MRERLACQFLLLSSITIVTLAIVAVVILYSHVSQRVQLQLASESSAKEDLIEQRLQRDWEHASLWARQSNIVNILRFGDSHGFLQSLANDAKEEGVSAVGVGVFSKNGKQIARSGVVHTEDLSFSIGRGTPYIKDGKFVGHIVEAPIRDSYGQVQGYLVVQFDMRDSLKSILSVSDIGESAELIIGHEKDGILLMLHHRHSENASAEIGYGSLRTMIERNDPLARAVLQQEGVIKSVNYEGRKVFAAYRYLPRLGWGLVLSIDSNEALLGVRAMIVSIIAVGLLLLGMSMLLSASIASRMTTPLINMATSMKKLGPGHWIYKQTVNTGDEIEFMDRTVAELSSKLRSLYKNLEKEVKKQTQDVREQSEMKKAILDSTVHGVMLTDAEGSLILLNPAAQKILGRDAEMSIGLPVLEIFHLCRQSKEVNAVDHPVIKCIHSCEPIVPRGDTRWSVVDPSGNLLPIDMTVTPVLDGKKIIGTVVVFRDVTEERRMEELKTEFISLASHQLRSPLSIIKWYTELLEDKSSMESKKVHHQYTLEIAKAGDRMSDLVDALLQAAQLESNGLMAEKRKVNMNMFVSDLGEELNILAKRRGIKCGVKVPKEHIVSNTDPVLLHIVVQNLFSNAVKYTKEGGDVVISLKAVKDGAEISVKDTGIGIPKKSCSRIFQRLFRAENVKALDTDGTGLGLYISKMIVDLLDGKIDFVSKESKGTTFTVFLPTQEISKKKK